MIKKIILIIGCLGLFSSCVTKNSTYWIRGNKVPCSGVGKMQCLQIYKDQDLKNATWELLYEPIRDFDFEEGIMKKVELKKIKLDPKEVPTDASTIQYEWVKTIDQQNPIIL